MLLSKESQNQDLGFKMNCSSLRTHWMGIKRSIESHGFVRLQMHDSSKATLRAVAGLFGASQKHVRNVKDGMTEVVGTSHTKNHGGQVVSQIEFFPHTDGHYLNGVMRQKSGSLLRVGAPPLILLQCLQPAEEGGASLLVDGKKILERVVRDDQNLLKPLFARDQTAVLRGDHLVMDSPVFKQLSRQRYSIRFSYDRDFLCNPALRASFDRFNKKYILNHDYGCRFSLRENEICIIDNQRMLHGRTAFTGERILRRLWLFDQGSSSSMISPQGNIYYETDASNVDPLAKFAAYGPHHRKKTMPMKPFVKTGITLSRELQEKLQRNLHRLWKSI